MRGFIRLHLAPMRWCLLYGQVIDGRVICIKCHAVGSYLNVTEMAQVLQVHLIDANNGELTKAEL